MKPILKKAYRISKAHAYEKWLKTQTKKEQAQIAERLEKIEAEGHFGDHKLLFQTCNPSRLRLSTRCSSSMLGKLRRTVFSYLIL
jgi:hypothetical protein